MGFNGVIDIVVIFIDIIIRLFIIYLFIFL